METKKKKNYKRIFRVSVRRSSSSDVVIDLRLVFFHKPVSIRTLSFGCHYYTRDIVRETELFSLDELKIELLL